MTEEVLRYVKSVLHVVSDDGIKKKVALTDGKSGEL